MGIAHAAVVRSSERGLATEASSLRAQREEVNKKRKLDQVSCGNELRKLARELEQYQLDNKEVEKGVMDLESEVLRLKRFALERGVDIKELFPDDQPADGTAMED